MTEENNQDMAMEDILSSIKNILEEDEANRQSSAEPEPVVEPTPEPVADAESVVELPALGAESATDVEDILELSPDMQVIEEPVQPAPEQEINLDDELGNIETAEFSLSDSKMTDNNQVVQGNASLGMEDLSSDPFDSEEGESQTVVDAIAEPEPVVEPKPIVEVVAEPVVEPEPVVEFAPEPTPTPEPQPTPVVEEKNTAVDVSANIISNFTKMFSHSEPKPAEPAPESIKLVGDGCKTIEDVIADVIRRIIGAEVEQNWRGEADYDTFAREVIVAQTKTWLDANLPTIVESIVKQEIERVMAKVGSNQ